MGMTDDPRSRLAELNRMESEHKAWLDGLSVGDEVAFVRCGHWVVRKIRRITPKRMFVLDNGDKYNTAGDGIGEGCRYGTLSPVTPEVREEARKASGKRASQEADK